ncbi:unnamed protein product [Penicillium glandicola]
MRSAVIFAALAVGTCAKVIEKEVYVTEWTTVTVTETVTQWPTNAPSTAVILKQQHTRATDTTVPTVQTTLTSAVSTTAAVPTTTAAVPTTTAAPTTAAEVETIAASSSTTSSSTTQAEIKTVASAASAATSVATSSATSTSTAATSSATSTYQESILYYHNIHRAVHSADDLTWSSGLESAALTLASTCSYGHDTSIAYSGGSYGQNIAYGYEAALVGEKVISEMMYTDEAPYFANLYGEANPDMTNFSNWGHFSQIVWKATTLVGCATVDCTDLANVGGAAPYTVCNYASPGNVEGEYADNISKPSS